MVGGPTYEPAHAPGRGCVQEGREKRVESSLYSLPSTLYPLLSKGYCAARIASFMNTSDSWALREIARNASLALS